MDKNQFQPAYLDDCRGLSLKKMDSAEVALYLFLYGCVGERWRWRDRLLLTERQLEALLAPPGTSVHVLYVDNVAAGYIELAKSDESTKIVYLGLCPDYIGKDLGKHLLSYGIEQAWNDNAKRLWLHTCNMDSPYTLNNYIKHGFSIYKVHKQSRSKLHI